jgi:DNA-binding LacI/PurR family transcriptional regulator
MLLLPADADDDGDLVRSAIVDAFILCSIRDDDPAVTAVRSRHLPFVSSGAPRLPHATYVGIDNRKAAVLAAEHLLALGHRRFGVVGVPEEMPVEPDSRVVRTRQGFAERVSGFIATVAAAGIDPDAVVVAHAETNSVDSGAEATTRLLARRQRPTAIFAVSDVLALGTLSAAATLGVAVPGDLSVVGFDDIDEAAHSRPALTTIAQDLRGQGRQAARLALELVEGKSARSRPWRPHLLVRQSTANAPRARRRSSAAQTEDVVRHLRPRRPTLGS